MMWYPRLFLLCFDFTSRRGGCTDLKGFLVSKQKPVFDTKKQSCFQKTGFFLLCFFASRSSKAFFFFKLPVTDDLGNSWCDYQHVSRAWEGRVRAVRAWHTVSHVQRSGFASHMSVSELWMCCSAERNKYRHIPPWPERQRRPLLIITHCRCWDTTVTSPPSGDGCGLSYQQSDVQSNWQMQVPVNSSIIRLLTSFAITSHKFSENTFFFTFGTVSCKRVTYLFTVPLAVMEAFK